MTKQLHQIIEEKGSAVVFGDILDNATQEALAKHFYLRYACDDDDKFIFYLQRNMEERKREYELFLNLETKTAQVDPLVIDLKQRTLSLTKSGAVTDSTSKTLSKLSNITENTENERNSSITAQATAESNSTATNEFSNSDSGTRTDNLTQTDNTTDKTRSLHSDTPQTNVSAATSGGVDDNITWTYASDLTDGYSHAQNTTTNTGTQSTSGSSSGSGENTSQTESETNNTQTGTETTEGTKTKQETGSGTETTTKTGSNNGNEDTEEQLEGRAGHLVSEILDDWARYIKKTDAFLWLCEELERCFMPNLLYGEDDD